MVRWIEVLGPDAWTPRGVIRLVGSQSYDPGFTHEADPEYDPAHSHPEDFEFVCPIPYRKHTAEYRAWHANHHEFFLPHVHDETALAYDTPVGIAANRERRLRGDA